MGSTAMKLSNGFENFWPSLFVFVVYPLCYTAVTYAMTKYVVMVMGLVLLCCMLVRVCDV